MTWNRFLRYQLQTTDVEAGRIFYSEVLGSDFWGSDVWIEPLPKRAASRGAQDSLIGAPRVDGWTTLLVRRTIFPIMGTERIERRIDRLLDQAEEAMDRLDWESVRDGAKVVLA